MKKTFRFMLAAFAIVVAASCAQELDNPDAIPQEEVELVPMTISVGGETKTTVGDDDKTINWCEDDVIAVFDNTGEPREFTIVEGKCNGKTATFEGLVAAGTTDFTAVYPYSAAVSVSDGIVTVNAAETQTLGEANIAEGATLSVASFKKGDAAFDFKTAIGYLRVDVDKDDVTSIIVKGSNIAGQATFNAAGELQEVKEGKNQVTLTPNADVFAAGSYYLTLLPGTTAENFNITLVRKNEFSAQMTAEKSVTIPRNGGFFLDSSKLTFKYVIKDAVTFQNFLSKANTFAATDIAEIVDDIDLIGVTIATAPSFKGTLDGGGHSLKNWTSDATPLFTTFAGTVKNIVIDESCQLTPATDGGKFGFITNDIGRFGRLENCTNNADITLNAETVGQLYFGSLAGVSYGTISGCTNNGDITFVVSGNVTENGCVGGIAGYVNVSDQYKEKGDGYDIAFENCVNNGNLSYTVNGTVKYLTFGGIAGGTSYAAIASEVFRGTAKNCVNTGNLSYTFKNGGSLEDNAGSAGSGNYTNIGGVFGYWAGNIENCTNGVQGDASKGGVSLVFPTSDASACASRPAVGGVCAFVLQNMTGCNNYGKVYMKGSAAGGGNTNAGCGLTGEITAGGIVAQIGPASNATDYKLSNCHNHGEVDIRAWMAAGNGTGFDLGGAVGYCGVPVENISNNGKVTIESKGAYVRAGGVIGKTVYAAGSLTNNGEVSIKGIRTSGSNQIGSELHFGGVVGHASKAISTVKNTRACTFEVNTIDKSAQLRAGGVVGSHQGNLTSGINSGDITVTPGGEEVLIVGGVAGHSKTSGLVYDECQNSGAIEIVSDVKIDNQIFVSGILGRVETIGYEGNVAKQNGVSLLNCQNSGAVTVNVPNGTSNGANACISGIASSSDQNIPMTDCSNTGDLTLNMPASQARIGGIAAYNGGSGKCTRCTVECDIALQSDVTTPHVGGMVGYSNPGKYIDCSYKGKVSVRASGAAGGILGYTKGTQTMEGCKINAEFTYQTGAYAGLFIGSSDAGKTYTLGTAEKPCQVVSGSKVGSTTVTALDDATDAAGVLVGRKNAVTVNAANTSVVAE